ncbi:heavy-metal-associated domain-containing protein [Nakamurella endophytica]|uniref:Metal-binding protein n=1 Tax=Nakamurella endophytica TaxID=1748367 RepID=A0A917SPK4_9ACTN|nr:heavy-metal-associated domain-containing protein [Nakamurella endophytica]GGL91118.1 metal-binding protein [Nakamurella endophytica]
MTSTDTAGGVQPATATFQVEGMTCSHCVAAVTEELAAGVPGVSAVDVDLPSGRVTVTGDRPVSEDAVRVAVDEAGYQLVPGSLR